MKFIKVIVLTLSLFIVSNSTLCYGAIYDKDEYNEICKVLQENNIVPAYRRYAESVRRYRKRCRVSDEPLHLSDQSGGRVLQNLRQQQHGWHLLLREVI